MIPVLEILTFVRVSSVSATRPPPKRQSLAPAIPAGLGPRQGQLETEAIAARPPSQGSAPWQNGPSTPIARCR